jgi:hypothetical protein
LLEYICTVLINRTVLAAFIYLYTVNCVRFAASTIVSTASEFYAFIEPYCAVLYSTVVLFLTKRRFVCICFQIGGIIFWTLDLKEGQENSLNSALSFTIFEIYKYCRVHLSSGVGGSQMFVVRNSTTPPPPATFLRCCYITVDPEMHTSGNRLCFYELSLTRRTNTILNMATK